MDFTPSAGINVRHEAVGRGRFGLAFGLGYGIVTRSPKFQIGLTHRLGNTPLLVYYGATVRSAAKLSDAVYDNSWGTVFNHESNTITEVPTVKRVAWSPVIGLGWVIHTDRS